MTSRPRKGDPAFGPTCACGGPKAQQARTCQPCHGVIRGYNHRVELGQPATADERKQRLVEALGRSEGELHRLIEQQLRDDRTTTAWPGNGVLSLDAPGRNGHTLYDQVAA